jgi:hypothetical protein
MSKVSLGEFAAQGRPRTCSVCTLPEEVLAEVNEGLRQGIGPTPVARWLVSEGHRITFPMVMYHKYAGHFEEDL